MMPNRASQRFAKVLGAISLIAGVPPAHAQDGQLFTAVSKGDLVAVQALFKSGKANAGSYVDDQRNTPLHLAAERCNPAMVRYLLANGGNPSLPNKWGDTPRRIAQVRCGASAPATIALGGAGAANPPGEMAKGAMASTPGSTGSSSVASPVAIVKVGSGLPGARLACLSEAKWMALQGNDASYAINQVDGGFTSTLPTMRYLVVSNTCKENLWVFSASCSNAMAMNDWVGNSQYPPFRRNELTGIAPSVGLRYLIPGEKMAIAFEWEDAAARNSRFPQYMKMQQTIYSAVSVSKSDSRPVSFLGPRTKYVRAFNQMLGVPQKLGPNFAEARLGPLSANSPHDLRNSWPLLKPCQSLDIKAMWDRPG